jgi:hypothetical protein
MFSFVRFVSSVVVYSECHAIYGFECRLLKKTSEARRAKIDERRRTLLYVDTKSVEQC